MTSELLSDEELTSLWPLTPAGEKSPAAAGALSLLIPGAGSYYAGNGLHGTIHLLTAVASLALLVGEAASCLPLIVYGSLSAESDKCNETAGNVTAGVYLVNWGWSIVTAVRDARSHNAKVRMQ